MKAIEVNFSRAHFHHKQSVFRDDWKSTDLYCSSSEFFLHVTKCKWPKSRFDYTNI